MRANLNFLPRAFRRQQVIRHWLIRWSVLSMICLLTLAMFGWHQFRLVAAKQLDVSILQQKHEAFLALQSSVNTLEKELTSASLESKDFNSSVEYPMLTLMGKISQAAAESSGRLSIRDFRFHQLKEKSAATDIHEVTIDGIAIDANLVESFTEQLRTSGMFREVKILSTAQEKRGGIPFIRYQLYCNF